MNCAACGAPANKGRRHCAICGYARDPDANPRWDRMAEAAAHDDLEQVLEKDESLLALTRGRLMGSWRPRAGLNPRLVMSAYANLGLTGYRLLLQPVLPGTGRSLADAAAAFPVRDVSLVTQSDADAFQPGQTVRLVVQFSTGDSFRLRASGRFAAGAAGLAEVWRSLFVTHPRRADASICHSCQRELDRPYHFCPFCGSVQESAPV